MDLHPSARRFFAVGVVLAVAIVACGDDADTTIAEPGTLPDSDTVAEPEPGIDGEVPEAAAEACIPPGRTSLSTGWEYLKVSGLFNTDFVFFTPPDWVDIAPGAPPAFGDAFHVDNVGEAGVDPGAAVASTILVGHARGLPVVLLLPLEGVASPLEVLYARQEAHLGESPGFSEVTRTAVDACFGGEPALGFEAALSDGGIFQVWVTVRRGTLFQIFFQAENPGDAAIIAEMIASWAWDADADRAVAEAEG